MTERVVLLDRVGGRRVVVDERAEREPREQLVAALARRAAIAQRLEVDVERHVGPDRHQLAALQRLVAMRRQRLALLRLELGRVREQRVEAAELRDQIDRALLADARHAGDVVARVADEREHVDDLRRLHAELLDDAGLVEPRAVLARVVDADRPSRTSWKKSLSIDTIATSKPAAAARVAIVPITSSAS